MKIIPVNPLLYDALYLEEREKCERKKIEKKR